MVHGDHAVQDALNPMGIWQDLVDQYFPELENVKFRLTLAGEDHAGAPASVLPKRDPEAVQLTTSNVPSINWAELGSSPTVPQAQTLDLGFPDDMSSLTDNFQRFGTSVDLLTGPAPGAALPVLPTFQTHGYFFLLVHSCLDRGKDGVLRFFC